MVWRCPLRVKLFSSIKLYARINTYNYNNLQYKWRQFVHNSLVSMAAARKLNQAIATKTKTKTKNI